MKNLFYITVTFMLAAFFVSCKPVEKRDGVGDVVTSADQISATATQIVDNGLKTNRVMLHCTSKVLCQWSDGVRTLCSSDTAINLFLTGAQTITLTARAADGTQITKSFDISVDVTSYYVAPQYGYFCGSGVKTWTWASADCFGNGGGSDQAPAWWKLQPDGVTTECTNKSLPAEGLGATMAFTLKGLKMVKTTADGATTAGTFLFDMNAGKSGWSIGTVSFTNTNILCGYDFNATGYTAWSTYNIISLNETTMVLGAQEHSPNSNYWYWVFKVVE